MHIINIHRIFTFLPLIMLIFLSACTNTAAQTSTTTPDPILPTSPSITGTQTPTTSPTQTPAQSTDPPAQSVNRVEVVYFHLPARCVTCICFETQLNFVMQVYFQGAINTNKMVYKVVEIGKKENAAIVSKYNAYGSQLFINVIKDNKDTIKEIQEIWYWKCPTDKNGFNMKIKNLIEQSLSKLSTT